MIIVTGAFGFIGSQLVHALTRAGHKHIVGVDDLEDGHKFSNLSGIVLHDYLDQADFRQALKEQAPWTKDIQVIFHQGACSTTTEWNGHFMMDRNYHYSCDVLQFCLKQAIPLIYASSAAVYGGSTVFNDQHIEQHPLNIYGYSKWLFDQYMLRHLPSANNTIVGLRYFNVYGPHEAHKGAMASVAYHAMNQLTEHNSIRLFDEYDGYAAGEHQRDFIHVHDVVDVNIWCWQNTITNGVYNLGTGHARSFNDMARALIAAHGDGHIDYIPFPEHLKGAYQSFTEADMSSLRQAGYAKKCMTLEEGIAQYYAEQHKNTDTKKPVTT